MRTGGTSRVPVLIETLEGRMMLSAAPAAHHPKAHHTASVTPAAHHAKVHHTVAPAVHKPASPKAHGGKDPIFMQINGIAGDVAVNGFVGDIQVNSFQFGVGVGVSSPTGGSSDRETSAPSVSEIVVTKTMDKTSAALLRDLLGGTDIPEVDISFVNLSKNGQNGQVYAKYVLSDVILSGYSTSSGGDRPSESLSLNFTKIQYSFSTQNADGTTTTDTVAYDLGQAKLV